MFQGGRTLAALAAVCNDDGDLGVRVLPGVESLVEQSLLQQREGRGGEPRFGMLETIQEFARERLAESGEAAALQDVHARTFLTLITAPQQAPNGAEEIAWLNQLDDEQDNLRAVLRWAGGAGDVGSCGTPPGAGSSLRERLAAVFAVAPFLGHFWTTRGYVAEGRRWLAELLATARQVEAAAAPAAPNGPPSSSVASFLVEFWATRGYTAEGRRQMVRLLAAATQLDATAAPGAAGAPAAAAWALLQARAQEVVASLAEEQGDYEAAQVLGEQVLAVVVAQQDTELMARAYHLLGIIAMDREDYPRARQWFEQSLHLYRELGDEQGLAVSLSNLGITFQQLGDWPQAEQVFQEAVTIQRRYGDSMSVAYLLLYLAHGAYMHSSGRRPRPTIARACPRCNRSGRGGRKTESPDGLGWLAQVAGQPERRRPAAGGGRRRARSAGPRCRQFLWRRTTGEQRPGGPPWGRPLRRAWAAGRR